MRWRSRVAKEAEARYDFYGPHYQRFGSEIAARIRREVYGEDLGQTGWRSASEQALIAELLRLGAGVRLLDIACGSGGPSLALAASTGCAVVGLDIEPAGIAHAREAAAIRGLAGRGEFELADCSGPLPFANGSFAAVLCADAASSLPDRAGTVREWARVLRPGGRLLFTDALVLTGEITKPELDLRASQGVHLIVPAGWNEGAIAAAGLTLLRADDTTDSIETIATALHDARSPPGSGTHAGGGCRLVRLAAALSRRHRRARPQPPDVPFPLSGREAGPVARKDLQTGGACRRTASLLGWRGRGGRSSMSDDSYPRDMVGYGRNPPDPRWPGEARIAVQFVLNYEEGGENCILHGDAASEAFLSEITGAQPLKGVRHMNMELIYEYGSRAGFWRLWRMFGERGMPLTVYGVGHRPAAQSRRPSPPCRRPAGRSRATA